MEEYELKGQLVTNSSRRFILLIMGFCSAIFIPAITLRGMIGLGLIPQGLSATGYLYVICGVYFASLTIFIAVIIVLYSLKRLVRADQNGVNIRILFFGKMISEQNYEYIDIKRVGCTVEKHKVKYMYYYEMVLTFMFSVEKKLCLYKDLKINTDLEKKDPSAFETAISNDPMMQLAKFVENNRVKAFYEKNPELRPASMEC